MSCEPSRTIAYHPDLRWRIVYQQDILEMSVKTVSKNLCVDQSTVRRILKIFDNTSPVDKKLHNRTIVRKLSRAHQLHILEMIIEQPSMYLGEMKKELYSQGVQVDESTICRFLKKSGFQEKKKENNCCST